MTPADHFRLPLRWQFVPLESPTDRAIRWRWRAYSQSGKLSFESETDFETLTQCMEAAKAAGYAEK